MIERSVMSALKQDYKNIEIIIVDNNSSDRTLSIIKSLANEYKNIKYYKNSSNFGALRNFEISIKYSTGEYVILLGSDDWIETDFISKKIGIIKKHPKIAIVSGAVKIYNQIDDELYLYSQYNYKSHYMTKEYINYNFYKKFIISYFCIFRRDLILKNFRLDYEDKHEWGVYKKGLGLDLINCLDIANTSKDFLSYYATGGAYCFCNVEERESNDIIKLYKTNNTVTKTIRDYKFNVYILCNHLLKYNFTAANKLKIYRNRELMYEFIRKIFNKDLYDFKNLKEFKEYKSVIGISNVVILWHIMTLPVYILLRVIKKFKRALELKIDKLIFRL
jgi:glycosyltransferase involved in cell wall biosynthesis